MLIFVLEIKTVEIPLAALIVAGLFLTILFVYLFVFLRYGSTRRTALQLESEKDELIKEVSRVSEKLNKVRELSSQKTTFIANTSHEIRTPLNAIYGFAELLAEQDLTKKEQQEYVEMILRNSNVLLSIVNDIIDIVKKEKGLLLITKEQFNLNRFIDEMSRYLRRELKVLGKEHIEINATKFLPDESSCFLVDYHRVQKIMIKLLDNALKYTKKGHIEFGYKLLENEFLLFYVSDSGIGIEKEYQKSIFDEFTQIQSIESKVSSGSGLGLAVSKSLVEAMGGQIWVESVKDSGATFYFTIPCEPCNNEMPIDVELLTDVENGCWAGHSILIVDDYMDIYYYFSETLLNTGVHLLYADSGQRAIDICKEHPEIELILMDIQMPDMSGIDVTEEIRKFRKSLPIIAQTAYAQPEDIDLFLDAGFNDLITKPIEKVTLLRKMSKYLDR